MTIQNWICKVITKLIRKWITFSGQERKADMVVSAKTTQELHSKYSDTSSGIGYLKGTFSLQFTEGMKQHEAPPRHVAYTLWEPFKRHRWTTRATNNGTTWDQ